MPNEFETKSDPQESLRPDGRADDELRSVRMERSFLKNAEGSVLFQQGSTRVICAATVGGGIPDFRRDSGGGWVTAEYSMLPRSTEQRKRRQGAGQAPDKRSIEISRFLGRCLRAVVDLEALGSNMIQIDCDVIDADAGTRVAALTGSLVALHDALLFLHRRDRFEKWPLREYVAGISVAMYEDRLLLDPCYREDHAASVDLTLVVTNSLRIVEVHGAAEGAPYERTVLDDMIALGIKGAQELFRVQEEIIGLRSPGGPMS